jgi:hypothetical protein
MTYTQAGSATRTSLIVVLVVCALLATAVMLLPKGFSGNLSKIGQGSVVVVLTHDKNTVGSMQFMALLNKVRSDYAGKVDFLAVDIATSEGQAFIRQQGVGAAVLVMFGPDGVRRGVLGGGIAEKDLRSTLDVILSP